MESLNNLAALSNLFHGILHLLIRLVFLFFHVLHTGALERSENVEE